MKRQFALLVVAGFAAQAESLLETFGNGENQFQIEFITIGNPGNPADTTGNPNPAGGVGYPYRIGKFEISRGMLEKANQAGGLGITLQDMVNNGGNGLDRPGTGISWFEAARFVNWMNASSGSGIAYKFDTHGVIQPWLSSETGYQANNPFRNSMAKYFLPSRDEWYKAAYGSPGGAWSDYPNGSDTRPAIVTGGTTGAVYGLDSPGTSPADITAAGGFSPFGTMAQGGNVWEWMEDLQADANPSGWLGEIRGGSWQTGGGAQDNLSSLTRDQWQPGTELSDTGFRVAMVPEPSSLSLILVGGMMIMVGRRKRG